MADGRTWKVGKRHEQAGEEATASVMTEWPQMLQQQYGGPSPEMIDYIRRANAVSTS